MANNVEKNNQGRYAEIGAATLTASIARRYVTRCYTKKVCVTVREAHCGMVCSGLFAGERHSSAHPAPYAESIRNSPGAATDRRESDASMRASSTLEMRNSDAAASSRP